MTDPSRTPTTPIVVVKFGSSVLRSDADLPAVVHAIYGHLRRGRRVLAVVSALGDTTDRLLAQARALGASNDHAVAALLATGEAQSVALLALALARAGLPAHFADARAIGLRTRGAVLDAEPIRVDVAFLRRCLAERPVLVVPGFVGVDADDRATLLGRGGSDLSAVFLAVALAARACVLCKDVDGVYDRDPAVASGARRFAFASHVDALAHGGRLVQSKAIDAARAAGIELRVAGLHGDGGTRIGAGASVFAVASPPRPPLRVGLIGLGHVGAGVHARLSGLAAQFTLVGAAVRDCKKARAPSLLTLDLTDDGATLAPRCDVLVDVSGDVEHVAPVLATALARGVHVVSANKALLARHLPALRGAARHGHARLLFSAAVGGAVPMLALVARVRALGIARVDAILNTTTNFVLAEMARGRGLTAALEGARAAGFAEPDATRDLDGRDAADKLVLLADAAFGVALPTDAVARVDVRDLDPARARVSASAQRELRVVASLTHDANGVVPSLAWRELNAGDPLFGTPSDHNRIVVFTEDGGVHVAHGGGGGCWPTTEAIVGDLLALWREGNREVQPSLTVDADVATPSEVSA